MSSLQVANTIRQQLGGNKFVAMTGAKDFVGGENFLQFKLPRAAKYGINTIKIILNPNDLYTIKFYKIRAMNVTEISDFEMVYATDLKRIFEEQTGLATSL